MKIRLDQLEKAAGLFGPPGAIVGIFIGAIREARAKRLSTDQDQDGDVTDAEAEAATLATIDRGREKLKIGKDTIARERVGITREREKLNPTG